MPTSAVMANASTFWAMTRRRLAVERVGACSIPVVVGSAEAGGYSI